MKLQCCKPISINEESQKYMKCIVVEFAPAITMGVESEHRLADGFHGSDVGRDVTTLRRWGGGDGLLVQPHRGGGVRQNPLPIPLRCELVHQI